MSASQLYFNHVYEASAGQTTTLEVTGEEQPNLPSGVTGADEVIVVSVTKAQMDALMTVGSQGTTGVGYPEVTLDWSGITPLDAKWAAFLSVQPTGSAPETFDDDEPTAKRTLQKVFATEEFTFVTNATNPLLRIPPEAINDVDYSGAITVVSAGGAVLSNEVMVGAGATILQGATTAPSGDLSGLSKESAVRGLFLQALAAGKYKQSAAKAPDGSDLPTGKSDGFDFAVGDVVSVFTVLSLLKTRSFVPDNVDVLPGAAGMKFKVNGAEIIVDGADDTVASDPRPWRVEWKLTVA